MRPEAAENLSKVLQDGPRLRTGYNTWIEARAEGKVLKAGLGSFGLGTMWMDEMEKDRDDPTYTSAPFAPGMPDGFLETADGRPPDQSPPSPLGP